MALSGLLLSQARSRRLLLKELIVTYQYTRGTRATFVNAISTVIFVSVFITAVFARSGIKMLNKSTVCRGIQHTKNVIVTFRVCLVTFFESFWPLLTQVDQLRTFIEKWASCKANSLDQASLSITG